MKQIEFQELLLKKIKYHVTLHIPLSTILNSDQTVAGAYADHISDYLVVQLVAFLAGKHEQHIVITYPKDWWHALLDRWLPKKLRKLIHIKYTHHEINKERLYPNLSFPKDDLFSVVRTSYHTWQSDALD